ncbi:MAG: HIT domain-containing protein [Candidatus Solibacter sp.]
MSSLDCTFCQLVPEDAWLSTPLVMAIPHPEPAGPCHLIVAPRRHVPTFYDLDIVEQRALWDALAELRERISLNIAVPGFQAGFVDAPRGEEAGFHTFVHLIPRLTPQPVALPPGAQWVEL